MNIARETVPTPLISIYTQECNTMFGGRDTSYPKNSNTSLLMKHIVFDIVKCCNLLRVTNIKEVICQQIMLLDFRRI